MSPRAFIWILAVPALWAADKPSREIQELQRDVAQLQEMVKSLQRSLDERLTALQTQVQNSVEAAGKANAAVAAVQRSLEQSLKDQSSQLVPQVNGVAQRFEQMSGDVRTIGQSIADLTSTFSKMQVQIGELDQAMKVMQAPPVQPPGPGISAVDLFANAERDREAGKNDLAIQEYAQYMQWYGDTALAPGAQYQLGYLHYLTKDYESAVKDFEVMAQKYAQSNRMPECLYYAGMSLTALGRKSEAADAFKELRRRFPNHALAKKSLAR